MIDAVATPVYNPSQVISGTKEPYSAILLDGQDIIENTEQSSWQQPVYLQGGTNRFVFTARDRADNSSDEATVEIFFDDIKERINYKYYAKGKGLWNTRMKRSVYNVINKYSG